MRKPRKVWDGESIEQLRTRLGYTLKEFCWKLNCTYQSYHNWTKNLHSPHELFQRAFDRLEKEADELEKAEQRKTML